MHGGGGFGVQRPQARPKRLVALAAGESKILLPYSGVGGRGRRGAAGQQQFDIQPRAARKDGQPAAGAYVPRGCGGADGEVGRGKGRVDVEDVDEMVRDARPLGRRGLGGADVHPAVDLHRVARENLAVQFLGQPQRERALAGRGGADDDQQRQAGAHHEMNIASPKEKKRYPSATAMR